MSDLTQFDRYLKDDGPAALVIREHLTSVEGKDGVLFPATFAAGDGFAGGYNIDGDPAGDNICLIDTVGSRRRGTKHSYPRSSSRPARSRSTCSMRATAPETPSFAARSCNRHCKTPSSPC